MTFKAGGKRVMEISAVLRVQPSGVKPESTSAACADIIESAGGRDA